MATRVHNTLASMPLQRSPSSSSKASTSSDPEKQGHSPQSTIVNPEEQLGGVSKIEALYLVFGRGPKLWSLYASLAVFVYALTLAANTTYVYDPFSTAAYGKHSLLGAIQVAATIIYAVGQPFAARFADITSRAWAYTFGVVFYSVGFALIAGSKNVDFIVAGRLLNQLGETALNTTNAILVADLTPLQWRGFVTSLLAAPYIVNSLIASYITSGFGIENYRWGYGIFCIIIPVAIAPAIVLLFAGEIKAKRIGAIPTNIDSAVPHGIWGQTKYYFARMDGFGLLLLGIAWTLILIPFTLASGAKGGWSNASMIAMEAVGWVIFLFIFVPWEKWGSKHALCPARVYNKVFICCLVINIFYMISGMMVLTFWSSWVYVVKDYTTSEYTYLTLTLTIALCVFGVVAGIVQRATHNYKYPQLFGLLIRIVGMGITYYGVYGNASTAALVTSTVLVGLGGGFSVVASQVASQASVPHNDMSTAIALLSLWTQLGSSAGSAIATAIWNSKLPGFLRERLAGLATEAEITEIFGSIAVARALPEPILSQARLAYHDTVKNYLFLPGLILSFIPVVAGLLTTNYFLGTKHNAIEAKEVIIPGSSKSENEKSHA